MRIILWFIVFTLAVVAIIIYPYSRNWIIKKTIESTFNSSSTHLSIDSLESTKNKITIKGTNLFVRNINAIKIENITINYSLDEIINDKKATFHISLGGESSILGSEAILAANINYTATSFKKYNMSINIEKLSSLDFQNLGLNLMRGTCRITTTQNNHHISDCNITDGTTHLATEFKSDISEQNKPQSIFVKGEVKELPVDLHKLFHNIRAPNDTMQYLYDNLSGAKIRKGSWELNLPREFFVDFKMKPEYLNGSFDIENIALHYDQDFPSIEKINTILVLKGSLLDFAIPSAYTHNTKLENTSIQIDWGVEGDAEAVIKTSSKGPVADLTDYIPKQELQSLKDSDIDLTKFIGTAQSKISIIIPIGEAKNKYDITTNIIGNKLALFNDNIVVSNAKLIGTFDGKYVKIYGKALVNDMSSDINLTNILDDNEEFDNIINIKMNLSQQNTGNNMPLYSFGEGNALLDFSYKDKNNKSEITATSNLTNITFDLPKLGIHKAYGEKAILEIKGKTDDTGSLPLDINVTGSTIKIIGQAILSSKVSKLNFSKIISNDTDIKADIELEPEAIRTKISGKLIDLSKVNMMQFLTKDTSNKSTDIKAKFDLVRLKNGIYLDNFILGMKCSRTKCSEGVINANIGSKIINLLLDPHENHEEWKINITNAGAALKGFGMIENIKSGELDMVIKTNIIAAEAGKTVPIAEGNFSLKKFVTVDNKILTRLVSFVSLPGLMSTITNNKNISFTDMRGKFNYKDNVINIFDSTATGPFLDLTIKGTIFTDEHKVKIKGTVIPSLYGINQIVYKIPVLGTIFGGKHRKGIFSAPYSIEYKY